MGSNDDAIKQAPYRWGSQDTGIFAINAGEFVAKSLAGRKAQWAGDDALQTKTRKLAIVYPTGLGGVDMSKFEARVQAVRRQGFAHEGLLRPRSRPEQSVR